MATKLGALRYYGYWDNPPETAEVVIEQSNGIHWELRRYHFDYDGSKKVLPPKWVETIIPLPQWRMGPEADRECLEECRKVLGTNEVIWVPTLPLPYPEELD